MVEPEPMTSPEQLGQPSEPTESLEDSDNGKLRINTFGSLPMTDADYENILALLEAGEDLEDDFPDIKTVD